MAAGNPVEGKAGLASVSTADPDAGSLFPASGDLYRQLVVRIWGWSAYFVELDKDFQDHVMARQEYSV